MRRRSGCASSKPKRSRRLRPVAESIHLALFVSGPEKSSDFAAWVESLPAMMTRPPRFGESRQV
jgi:hypothetical protein